MKKTFRTIAFAIAIMGLTVACNNNAAEEPVDSMPAPILDTLVEEPVIDTTPVVEEEPVAPAPAKKAPAKKKTTKKAEPAKEVKADASQMTVNTEKGITVSKSGIKLANGEKGSAKVDASGMTVNTGKTSTSVSGEGLKIAVKN
ncbi:MAG: hypothetical protein MJZ45_05040 [Bacteroidales bacterium]|nr:hypothetical protein [Bacteroidales bacterium]